MKKKMLELLAKKKAIIDRMKQADAAADQPGLVARLVEAVHDLEGVFTDIFAGNSMLLTRDHRHRRWFDGGFCLALLTA